MGEYRDEGHDNRGGDKAGTDSEKGAFYVHNPIILSRNKRLIRGKEGERRIIEDGAVVQECVDEGSQPGVAAPLGEGPFTEPG